MFQAAKNLSPAASQRSKILITGGNGYVGSFIVKLLLQHNHQVRVSVYDINNKPDYEYLYNLFPDKKDDIEIVEGKLENKAHWPSIVEGCRYVFHVASPTPDGPIKDGDAMIEAAVSGTLNVLEAALEKGVERVVITSSSVTSLTTEKSVVTEHDWAKESDCSAPYPKSKIRAERLAWEFYEKNKSKMQVVAVNPSFVLGPVLTKHPSTSSLTVSSIMNGEFLGAIDENLPFVDVRDVAEAHFRAMFVDEANGKRYLCSADPVKITEIINTLNQEFGSLGYKIPNGKATIQDVLERGGPFAKVIAGVMAGANPVANNERSVKDLGMKYFPF